MGYGDESSYMLAGSLVGGGGNGGAGGGDNIRGGSGVLGGKSGEGGHAPLRRPRVSPTTSLFMASRGRSPSSTRSESKTGKSPLPRCGIDICTLIMCLNLERTVQPAHEVHGNVITY